MRSVLLNKVKSDFKRQDNHFDQALHVCTSKLSHFILHLCERLFYTWNHCMDTFKY